MLWPLLYVWYNDESAGRVIHPPRPPFTVPNVSSHSPASSVPIIVSFCNSVSLSACLCALNGRRLAVHSHLVEISLSLWSNGVGHINQVALRRPRLVLRWVTVRRYTVFVCNWPSGQLSLLPSAGLEAMPAKGKWECPAAGKMTVGLLPQ